MLPMTRIAVFPGSFDPITRGHESIVLRALSLFDEIYVAVGENQEKKGFFTIERRLAWIQQVFRDYPQIKAVRYSGLTVEFCKTVNANFILRGLRTSADFEFERSIGQVNKKMHPEVETIFLLTAPEYTALNSSIVRDIIRHGGDAGDFVPEGIDVTGDR
jgi:pantetheine-phosphate adenylyltransferase